MWYTQNVERAVVIKGLSSVNHQLAKVKAVEVVRWGFEMFGQGLVMSTSFGIHSNVLLHLISQEIPRIPVIWIDTGYLPRETYQFAEQLTCRLDLNLKVYQSPITPARMEARFGRLWEMDSSERIGRYAYMRKIEPIQRALRELRAKAWVAGLRREQTDNRKTASIVAKEPRVYKILPILSWTTLDMEHYVKRYKLLSHPLQEKGYRTVGDWHSSRPVELRDKESRDTRFKGNKQECGLHLSLTREEERSLGSSCL